MPSRYASSGDTFSKSSVNMGSTAVGTDWVPRVSVDVGAGVGVPAAMGVGESVGVGTPVGSRAWEGAGVLAGAGAWSEQAESVSVAARAARYRSFPHSSSSLPGFPGPHWEPWVLSSARAVCDMLEAHISDCFRPLRGPLPGRRRRRYPGWSAFSAPLGPVTVLDIRAASTLRSGATARPIARSPPPLPPSAFHARDGLHRHERSRLTRMLNQDASAPSPWSRMFQIGCSSRCR